jgi:hypothetical protein
VNEKNRRELLSFADEFSVFYKVCIETSGRNTIAAFAILGQVSGSPGP